MYVPSHWTPPHWTRPNKIVQERLDLFHHRLNSLFRKRRGRTNLLPHQHRALQQLQQQRHFLIVPCDKNLGPSIIDTEMYLKIAFRDHLNDRRVYRSLNNNECRSVQAQLETAIKDWLKTHHKTLTKMERAFVKKGLNNTLNPFARFYLTLKAHKLKPGQHVDHLKSRPIVSCPGSLLHPLGIWVDRKLQPVAQHQRSYFKNSFTLLQQLYELDLPPGARLFTADAKSMYTNIPTSFGLATVARHLREYRLDVDRSFPTDAVRTALSLVMRNNVFIFGDMTFKQLNGTAMGTPPAPPYATIYYGIHESRFLDKYDGKLLYYKRFIDDVLGIFLPDPALGDNDPDWIRLQTEMNAWNGLEWEFSKLVTRLNFMDLTLSINGNRIQSTLYEKELNLHLYIPPHSAHPPGLLPGIVYGTLFRIFTLCNDPADRMARTRVFFQRLLVRGYKADKIKPLFYKAIASAKKYDGTKTNKSSKQTNYVILHLPFHPQDPASREIQRAWRETIASPQYKMPIGNLKNPKTNTKCGIERMIIAYKRPMNLGNLLSHRKLDDLGPPVSSYYDPLD